MYGLVNKSLEELLTEQYGEDAWEAIKEKSGVDVDFFLSNESYEDEITYKLVVAATNVLHVPAKEVLNALGEYWILRTGKEKYGGLMEAGGATLEEFLLNLPIFHNRVMLIYPKLTPPEFRISDVTERSIQVHYFSKRVGLKELVRGLLQGLAKMYNSPAVIELIQSREDGSDHEIFKVSW